MPGRYEVEMGARVESRDAIGRLGAVERHMRIESKAAGHCLNLAAECVLAHDVEVHILTLANKACERMQQGRIVLDPVEARHANETPWWPFGPIDSREA